MTGQELQMALARFSGRERGRARHPGDKTHLSFLRGRRLVAANPISQRWDREANEAETRYLAPL